MQINYSKVWTFAAVLLIVFLDFMSFGLTFPVLSPIFLNPEVKFLPYHYSESLRTILMAVTLGVYPFAQFFGAPILGSLSDRYGRKKILIISLIGAFIGNLAFVLGLVFSNVGIVVLGRLIAGFMGGNATIASSMMADISTDKTKSRNFGFIGLAMALGIIFGPLIGGVLSDPSILPIFSAATPFLFAAILALVSIGLVLICNETLKTVTVSGISLFTGINHLKILFGAGNLSIAFFITLMIAIAYNSFIFYMVFVLSDILKLTPSELAKFYAYSGLCLVISMGVANTILSQIFKPKQILTFSLLFLAISFFSATQIDSLRGFYLVMPFLSLFYGLSQANTLSIISINAPDHMQGEVLGINQSIQSFSEGVIPVLTSFLIAFSIGVSTSFPVMPPILAAFSVFIGWVIFMLVLHKRV